eukprot:Plantae.Rhodophyta-Purpureofilum_apyrenoidigerum.ctg19821.p1 GENE.Plantae.Rhodophyta-Purpureofilum_apyrenoidigerum.ctg19821~~Plantae.Rhodophyta-Purpureofilum_apyrenoidigerum.ctg19821.p1  ORF type:complete len:258 (-),score=48.20 Plantae.Rhodophyta-Purpureofilum_apyrenoidigerum.ctg19821:606-1379(-)
MSMEEEQRGEGGVAHAAGQAQLQPQVPTPVVMPMPQVSTSSQSRVSSVRNTPVAENLDNDTLARRIEETVTNVSRMYTRLLDQTTPLIYHRWIAFGIILLMFIIRIAFLQAFYIVCYVLFIFMLNQFILFLKPKDYTSLTQTNENNEDSLPSKTQDVIDGEFRPFLRRLPEFKFWYSITRATLMAFGATFFEVLDIPVFWPILVVYFIMLFVLTMRRQLMDMKQFKYVPWDIGKKKKYKSSVSVTNPAPSHSNSGIK